MFVTAVLLCEDLDPVAKYRVDNMKFGICILMSIIGLTCGIHFNAYPEKYNPYPKGYSKGFNQLPYPKSYVKGFNQLPYPKSYVKGFNQYNSGFNTYAAPYWKTSQFNIQAFPQQFPAYTVQGFNGFQNNYIDPYFNAYQMGVNNFFPGQHKKYGFNYFPSTYAKKNFNTGKNLYCKIN
ncbi:hypothetical protein KUTeg_004878 [Tegillarca granosa]|uniref:Uncharacterized protein n=1 Tax=Tegillarca granosa TaxID=220873 RepID=A0ABQ9FI47_TEGGR|nr:hypothetical protein KUTeg_004878 [Tegillarca granosa]